MREVLVAVNMKLGDDNFLNDCLTDHNHYAIATAVSTVTVTVTVYRGPQTLNYFKPQVIMWKPE